MAGKGEEDVPIGVGKDGRDDEIANGVKPMTKARKRMEEINRQKQRGKNMKEQTERTSVLAAPILEKDKACSGNELAGVSQASVPVPDQWDYCPDIPIMCAATVQYCPHCGLPPDYCEYSDCWKTQCMPWVLQNYPDYYPHLVVPVITEHDNDDSTLAAAASSLNLSAEKDSRKKSSTDSKKAQKKMVVTVQRISRAKRKAITVIIGLDNFGIKLEKAAKLCSKRFSCGASVVKGGSGIPDQVDIQGDVEETIAEFLITNFPEIDEKVIVYLKPK